MVQTNLSTTFSNIAIRPKIGLGGDFMLKKIRIPLFASLPLFNPFLRGVGGCFWVCGNNHFFNFASRVVGFLGLLSLNFTMISSEKSRFMVENGKIGVKRELKMSNFIRCIVFGRKKYLGGFRGLWIRIWYWFFQKVPSWGCTWENRGETGVANVEFHTIYIFLEKYIWGVFEVSEYEFQTDFKNFI